MHDVDDKLHRWRKQVKYGRYQLQSLSALMHLRVNKRAQRLAEPGHILGQDHDLALLQAVAGRMTPSIPDLRPKFLHALIDPRRLKLQADAFAMGASLYKNRPQRFAKKICRRGRCLGGLVDPASAGG